ncbi:MAG: CPBP family intramembrane metalloprotease [Candidatus Coatesbacteria bacterium]|nr:MAG: CPBP family intramembrane metalloprotease [Candidatus Coatesbacteria bacterium]
MGVFKVKGHFRTWFKVVAFWGAAVACTILASAGTWLVLQLAAPDYPVAMETAGGFDTVTFAGIWALGVLLFGTTVLLRRFLDGRRPLVSLGLDFRRAALPALWGCLTGVLVAAAAYLLIVVAGGMKPAFSTAVFAAPEPVGFAVALLVGAAAMEELAFRGYPIKVMDEQWSRWGAVLLTSVLFAVCHGVNPSANPLGLINVFLAGIMLALVYLKSGSLWAAVGFHFGWNFAEGPLLGSAVSGHCGFPTVLENTPTGPSLISGGGFGVEGSILTTAVAGVVIVLIVFNKFPLIRIKREDAVKIPFNERCAESES